MIIRSKGVFTFHSAITLAEATSTAKQHQKRGYKNASPTKFPILSPYTDQFVPFTFHKTITGEDITEILLIDYDILDSTTDSGHEETDLTSDTGLADLKTVDEYDEDFEEVLYEGDTLQATLTAGKYWLQLKCTATEYYYSNIFIIE